MPISSATFTVRCCTSERRSRCASGCCRTSAEISACGVETMVDTADTVDAIVTGNEVEALILEFELIHEQKPRFNIRLRDDKSYPYLALTTTGVAPSHGHAGQAVQRATATSVRTATPTPSDRASISSPPAVSGARHAPIPSSSATRPRGARACPFHIERCSGPLCRCGGAR